MRRAVGLAWAWLPVLAWTALILALSSQSNLPARTNPQTGETIRSTFAMAKLAHVVEYSVLGLLVLRALTIPAGGLQLALWAAVLGATVVAGLFGGVDEFRQSFVPNREPRVTDIALDTASALAAVLLAAAWVRLPRGMTSPPTPLRRGEGSQVTPGTAGAPSAPGAGASTKPVGAHIIAPAPGTGPG